MNESDTEGRAAELLQDVEATYGDFALAQANLQQFLQSTMPVACPHCLENVPVPIEAVMEALSRLGERYNLALEAVRSKIQEAAAVLPRKTSTIHDFRVTKKNTEFYDVEALFEKAPEVFAFEGVVKSVDRDRLDALISAGQVPIDVQIAARRTVATTPAVSGPKPLSFSLDAVLPTRRRGG